MCTSMLSVLCRPLLVVSLVGIVVVSPKIGIRDLGYK